MHRWHRLQDALINIGTCCSPACKLVALTFMRELQLLNKQASAVQAPIYSQYLGQMAKLAFLASAVHQFVFTVVSSLPFAVGQVQDVGESVISC